MDPQRPLDRTDEARAAAERERLRSAYPAPRSVARDRGLGFLRELLALCGPLAIWVTGVSVVAGGAPSTVGPGACEGIGFGCELSPHDRVVLFGWVVGLVVVPVATVATVAATALTAPRRGLATRAARSAGRGASPTGA